VFSESDAGWYSRSERDRRLLGTLRRFGEGAYFWVAAFMASVWPIWYVRSPSVRLMSCTASADHRFAMAAPDSPVVIAVTMSRYGIVRAANEMRVVDQIIIRIVSAKELSGYLFYLS
jgi:hypothetical protein